MPEGSRLYEGVGLQVAPAPVDAEPALSAEEAVDAYESVWGLRWHTSTPPRAELMLASNGVYTFEPGASTGFAATFTDRLVWVLSWNEVESLIASHDRRRSPRYGQSRDSGGRLVDGTAVVDAATGEVLAVLENGSELPPSAAHGHG